MVDLEKDEFIDLMVEAIGKMKKKNRRLLLIYFDVAWNGGKLSKPTRGETIAVKLARGALIGSMVAVAIALAVATGVVAAAAVTSGTAVTMATMVTLWERDLAKEALKKYKKEVK